MRLLDSFGIVMGMRLDTDQASSVSASNELNMSQRAIGTYSQRCTGNDS